MKIIPAINCETKECVEEHVRKVREFAPEWVHFDVSDGKFNEARTWNAPQAFFQCLEAEPPNIETHLMVEDPEVYVSGWAGAGAKRVLLHIEVFRDGDVSRFRDLFITKYKAVEFGLAVRPETDVETVFPYLDQVRFVQFLAVVPGFSGQEFQENVLQKIFALRAKDKDVIIEVDGGVNDKTAPLIRDAGADVLVSSSFIWNSASPVEAYRLLQDI